VLLVGERVWPLSLTGRRLGHIRQTLVLLGTMMGRPVVVKAAECRGQSRALFQNERRILWRLGTLIPTYIASWLLLALHV
jgi:hypothetical protein